MATTPLNATPSKPKPSVLPKPAPKAIPPTKKVVPDFEPNPNVDPEYLRLLEKKQAAVKKQAAIRLPPSVMKLKSILGKSAKPAGLLAGGAALGAGGTSLANTAATDMAKTHGDAVGRGVVDAVGDKAQGAWDATKQMGSDAMGYLKDKGQQAWDYTKKNPGTVAAGTGAALGSAAVLAYLLRNRKKKRSPYDYYGE